MRWLLVILLLLYCLLYCTSLLHVVEGGFYNSWFKLSGRYSSVVVLFDVEKDGVVETVAIEGYIYIHGVETPTAMIPFKALVDNLGELCLFLYNPVRAFMNAMCPSGFRRIPAPLGAEPRVYPYGFIMSDIVYTEGRIYLSPVARSGHLVDISGFKGVVGAYNESVILHVLETGEVVEVFPFSFNVVSALYSEETGVLYIALVMGEDTFILEYNYSSRTIVRYPTPLGIGKAVQGVSTRWSMFLLSETGYLYVYKPGYGVSLVARGERVNYPADSVDSFTLVGSSWIARVVDSEVGVDVEYLEVPGELGFVVSGDWWGSIVVVATDTGIYLTSVKPVSVEISAPLTVHAREEFSVVVTGDYDTLVLDVSGYVFTGNGSLNVTLRLPVGEHLIRARACRGLVCRLVEQYICVVPRPIEVTITHPLEVAPYELFEISVNVTDVITGETLPITCTIREAHGRLVQIVQAGTPVVVPALPDIDSTVYTITCGGGDYATISKDLRIKLTRLPYTVDARYRGYGVLELYAVNVYTGEIWTRELVARVGDEVYRGVERVEVLLKPGENTVTVYLVVGDREVFLAEIKVTYFEEISTVTPNGELLVGDRVETVTTTVVKPVFIPEPVEIEKPDPLVTVASAVLAAGVTYAVMTLITRSRKVGESA